MVKKYKRKGGGGGQGKQHQNQKNSATQSSSTQSSSAVLHKGQVSEDLAVSECGPVEGLSVLPEKELQAGEPDKDLTDSGAENVAEVPLSKEEPEVQLSKEEPEVRVLNEEPEVPLSKEEPEVCVLNQEPEVPLSNEETEVPLSKEETEVPLSNEEPEVPLSNNGTEIPLSNNDAEVALSKNETEAPVPAGLFATTDQNILNTPMPAGDKTLKGTGDSGSVIGIPKNKKPVLELKRQAGSLVDTLVLEIPVLREAETGISLGPYSSPPRLGRYSSPWDARSYAHKLPSHFSSFNLPEGVEGPIAGTVNFISDWENIKKLIKMPIAKESQSFVIHNLGDSIFVDELNLIEILMTQYRDGSWRWLYDHAKEFTMPAKPAIIREGKSNREVTAKEAFHKLLYFSIDDDLKLKPNYDARHVSKVPYNLRGSNTNFLRKMSWNLEDYSMLVGVNVPLFRRGKDSIDSCTLRLLDSIDSASISQMFGLDLWLDNTLLDISETSIVHTKEDAKESDVEITSTDWVKTEDLPKMAGFNPEEILKQGKSSFDFIKKHAPVDGHTYWLYKAPGCAEYTIHDITVLSSRGKNAENPFINAFASLLHRALGRPLVKLQDQTPTEVRLKRALRIFASEHPDHAFDVNPGPAIVEIISQMQAEYLFFAADTLLNTFIGPKMPGREEKELRMQFHFKLINSLEHCPEAFQRLKQINYQYAAKIALKMINLYEVVKEFYGVTTRELENNSSVEQLPTEISTGFQRVNLFFGKVSTDLTEVLELITPTEEWEASESLTGPESSEFLRRLGLNLKNIGSKPHILKDVIRWSLSTIYLRHAMLHLDSLSFVDDSAKIADTVNECLTSAIKYTNQSATFPSTDRIRRRIIKLRCFIGYIVKSKMETQEHKFIKWVKPLEPGIQHFTNYHRIFGDKFLKHDNGHVLLRKAIEAFEGVPGPIEDDSLKALVSFLNFTDTVLRDPKEILLIGYLQQLKSKLEDLDDSGYKLLFDVNERRFLPIFAQWEAWTKGYLISTGPFPTLLRVALRILPGLEDMSGRMGNAVATQKLHNLLDECHGKENTTAKAHLTFLNQSFVWPYSKFSLVLDEVMDLLECAMNGDFSCLRTNTNMKLEEEYYHHTSKVTADEVKFLDFLPVRAPQPEMVSGSSFSQTPIPEMEAEIANMFLRGDNDVLPRFCNIKSVMSFEDFERNQEAVTLTNPLLRQEFNSCIDIPLPMEVDEIPLPTTFSISTPDHKTFPFIGPQQLPPPPAKNKESKPRQKKLRKGETEYTVQAQDTPYDVDKIVETIDYTPPPNPDQSSKSSKSKKKKQKKKQEVKILSEGKEDAEPVPDPIAQSANNESHEEKINTTTAVNILVIAHENVKSLNADCDGSENIENNCKTKLDEKENSKPTGEESAPTQTDSNIPTKSQPAAPLASRNKRQKHKKRK